MLLGSEVYPKSPYRGWREGRPNSALAVTSAVVIMAVAKLNEEQAEALNHLEGPLLIVAGAGSGKTRTLTERVAQMISTGTARPEEILAITFTNKAAGEMRSRLERLTGVDGLWVLTFHAFGARVLRREIGRLGYERSFLIYDSDDQLAAVRRVASGLGLAEREEPARGLLWRISRAKNDGLDPAEVAKAAGDFRERRYAEVYAGYQRLLRQYQALDFDDLLLYTLRLFEEYPEVLEYYQERFHFILVDEFQDTNRAQYRLLRLLADRYRNLTAVGDPDQSIYGWRGANVENILTFERDYPEAKVILLTRNYRSTRTILEAANAVVRHNRERREKALWTENESGEAILLIQTPDDKLEGEAVAGEIRRILAEGRQPMEIAILYRTNAQSRSLEEGLWRHRIPYRVVGGLRFYERREVKDLLSYLRLLVNPYDALSLERALGAPRRGIGPVSMGTIRDWAQQQGLDPVTAFSRAGEIPGLSTKVRAEGKRFGDLLLGLTERQKVVGPAELLGELAEESGYLRELKRNDAPEAQARYENILALAQKAREFGAGGALDFLEAVALISDIDQVGEDEQAVTMMTVHSAKGLEFPLIFLAGLEEGLFPHSRSESAREVEEERRLFYVGVTRARERLIFTRALRRSLWGREEPTVLSRFVREVPAELLWEGGVVPSAPAADLAVDQRVPPVGSREGSVGSRPGARANSVSDPDLGDRLRVGQRVRHPKFGEGTIVALQGERENLEAAVAFPGGGVRRFLPGLAGLMPVEEP